jgi:HEAT repeat protein
MDKIIGTADKASWARQGNLAPLAAQLDDSNVSVRYWAAMGLAIAGERAEKYEKPLLRHTEDSSPEVRMEVAAALYRLGDRNKALATLRPLLNAPGIYLKLEALNVLQALKPKELPSGLKDRVQQLEQAFNVGTEPKSYIYRAAKSLLKKTENKKQVEQPDDG